MYTTLKVGIKSVGAEVPLEGKRLVVHSKFDNAINYILNGKLISLVSERVGGGPNNIVINAESVFFVNDFGFDQNSFIINGKMIVRSPLRIYSDSLNLDHDTTIANFLSGLNIFERILIKESPPLSTAFLLDHRRSNFFITPFEKKLKENIKHAVYSFMHGDLMSIKQLKGLGFGLTPQGDDLIDGFLLSLWVYEFLTGTDTSKLRESIFSLSETDNLISNTFLKYAVLGKFYERVKTVVQAIAKNDKEMIISSARSLLNIGETSGSDIGTGFILMSRTLFRGGNEWS